ncbi:MAG: HAD-IB family phosphatase [Acidimicrobiales bacterium]
MRWRPYPVTLFDCDSTLSAVEGIDELTTDPESQQQVAALTESAMDGKTPLEDVYGERLSLLKPTQGAMRGVKSKYKAGAMPHAQAMIAALNDTDTETWIISGGLLEPVAEFATWLGVHPDRVRAVSTEFDPLTGNWWQGDGDPNYADHDGGHLTTTTGKADVIRSCVSHSGRRMLVGDGVSDLAASSEVDLFVAYAGVVSRPAVVSVAPVVVTSESLAPVLALSLGPTRVKELVGGVHDDVARSCLSAIEDGALTFNDAKLQQRFAAA